MDLPTLRLVTVFVSTIVGSLLLFSWLQNRRAEALAWWAGSKLVAAIAALMFSFRVWLPDFVATDIAYALVLLAYGVFWTGMRRFEERSALLPLVVAGPLVWLLLCRAPEFTTSIGARVAYCSSVTAGYTAAAAFEIWRGRSEALLSRYPVLTLLLLHMTIYVVRVPLTLGASGGAARAFHDNSWTAVLFFELLLYLIVMSFLLLGITKERMEREQRAMATRDPLTGALNRRALVDEGARLLGRDRIAGCSTSLLLIDLDHFKRVNDVFGHAVGDRVLCDLCTIAADVVPGNARFARLGGEEFACLLPGMPLMDAVQLANLIRTRFAEPKGDIGPISLRPTLSAGIATSDEVGHDLEALLTAADIHLYRAKRAGRNCVVHALPRERQAA